MRCKAEYQLTIVRGYEYICYYWGNCDLIGETYALSCPANKYHLLSDSCISCDQMWAGYIEKGPENIARILAYSWVCWIWTTMRDLVITPLNSFMSVTILTPVQNARIVI